MHAYSVIPTVESSVTQGVVHARNLRGFHDGRLARDAAHVLALLHVDIAALAHDSPQLLRTIQYDCAAL